MTRLQARALLTMVESLPLPNQGYRHALAGIEALRKQATAGFCRRCDEAGTEKSDRGYPACPKHVHDMRDEEQETVHQDVREIHLKPGMQVLVKSRKAG